MKTDQIPDSNQDEQFRTTIKTQTQFRKTNKTQMQFRTTIKTQKMRRTLPRYKSLNSKNPFDLILDTLPSNLHGQAQPAFGLSPSYSSSSQFPNQIIIIYGLYPSLICRTFVIVWERRE
jgi:hypothetical protein